MSLNKRSVAALFAAFVFSSPELSAASSGSLSIELNNLSASGDACRVSFVIQNGLGQSIDELKVELVLFGKEGEVKRLLAVDVGQMPKSKTRVKQFDLKGLACSDIGRLLINNVTHCKGNELNPQICTAAVKTSSRLSVPFSY